jgi:hypothetical protein
LTFCEGHLYLTNSQVIVNIVVLTGLKAGHCDLDRKWQIYTNISHTPVLQLKFSSLRANPLVWSLRQVKLDSDKWKIWKNLFEQIEFFSKFRFWASRWKKLRVPVYTYIVKYTQEAKHKVPCIHKRFSKHLKVQSNLSMQSPVLKGHLFIFLSLIISYELNLF